MQVNKNKIKDETVQNLRDNGYMVIIFSPEELENVIDVSDIESDAISYINELIENGKEFWPDDLTDE